MVSACVVWACLTCLTRAAEPSGDELPRDFAETILPFLKSHCLGCHGEQTQEAKLDLSGYTSMADVSNAHPIWEIVLARLEANEMPPEEAKRQPKTAQRTAVVDWIRALRTYDANKKAGDPGPVLARRLSNAEYNYTIRDLTLVDMRPTKAFPVDPANEAGFDNSGESLTMSPALLNKYLDAAREVAKHLVLTPTDLRFAPHPVVTDTDRDKYCVKRIVEFYRQQPIELARYFEVCWQHANNAGSNLDELAANAKISPKYAALVWDLLHAEEAVGAVARLQRMFSVLPVGGTDAAVRAACEAMRDYVLKLRQRLAPTFPNLDIEGSSKGSQTFVLWKNRQYIAHRQKFARGVLRVEGDEIPRGTPPEFVLPKDEEKLAEHVASIERFCFVFPDAFYISERGRDYLDVPKEKQEKGRLLSAGFHSMMGYFRDDRPLYDLILDDADRRILDRLWQELNYVAAAPTRQYSGFLWFERTDSRYMRDPVFDFARPENKSASDEAMIERVAELYLEKAQRNSASDLAIEAVEDYFKNINTQIRRVEDERVQAEPIHVRLLLQFAERAWRRKLLPSEEQEIRAFYGLLRQTDGLSHEESIRDSIVSILMSPHFCYRMDMLGVGEGTRRLTSEEMASRLSYFLWSTHPDAQLWDLLNSPGGRLEDPVVIREQALRMLDDDKIRGLATEFAANWLDIRRFQEHNAVDRNRFPMFDDKLRDAMFEEPTRLFVDIARSDRSVLEFLDADYTFANSTLAQHYGITDIAFDGDEWKRVEQAKKFGRGGLLPMSVFLTKNAPGLRTSPVKRGYWVVRRLLGERIPPPPPNVPELPADESKLGDLSLREMLARHRDNKSCSGCHDRFDAIGLAFEGFGPVGERREKDLGGRAVEVAAKFPGGGEGVGIAGLRQYLREHRQDEFIENLCRKLLSYALGRTLMLSDERLITKMQSKLKADYYRFSSLIESIVTSRQFLNKRGGKQLVSGSQ